MRARLLTGLIAGVLLLVPSVVQAEDEQATLTVTSGAVQTLETGQLSLEAWEGTDTVGGTTFLMPVTDITFTRTGEVRAIRLSGGLTIAGEPTTVDLTNFRVNLPSQAASVRASSPDTRIRAFDVARLKISKKKVTGILLISPGTAAVLNEQFDTYVFSDGLRFARFEYAL